MSMGIRRGVILEADYLTGSEPSALINLANRKSSSFAIEDQTVTLANGQQIPNMVKHSIEAEISKVGVNILPKIHYLVTESGYVAAEIIGDRKKFSPVQYDGVFRYFGSNMLGFNFEYNINDREVFTKLTASRIFDKTEHKSLVDYAQVDDIEAFSVAPQNALAERPEELSLFHGFGFDYLKINDSLFFEKVNKKNFSLKITGKSTKNMYEMDKVERYTYELNVTLVNVSKEKLKEAYEFTSLAPKVELSIKGVTGYLEKHIFDQGVLALARDSKIAEEENTLALKFTGSIPVNMLELIVAGNNLVANHHL